jgi:hypothetical protein
MADSNNVLNDMDGPVGPFAHSERVPKPNTLPKEYRVDGNTFLLPDTYSGNGIVTGNVTISPESFSVRADVTSTPGNVYKTPELTSEFIEKVYEASHIYILLAFVVLYLVVYILLAYFLRNNGTENVEKILKRVFDIAILAIIIGYCIYYYNKSSPYTKSHVLSSLWNWSIDWMRDPINLYGIMFFSVFFYIWVFFLHFAIHDENTPFFIQLLEHKLWAIMIFFALFFIIQYFFGIDIYSFFFGNEYVTGLFNKFSDTKLDNRGLIDNKKGDSDNVHGNSVVQNEVFNIGNNLYSYDDAQHVCSSYGARLANYDEIEDAYNHGAEWCNYGWSDGQMAYFPTQKSTWDQLQKNPKNKNKCGRPGINGGYMDNPYLRFGVNCFGQKPKPTQDQLNAMNQPLPKTAEQAVIDQKVEFWKKNSDALLKVNSFNKNKWSEF